VDEAAAHTESAWARRLPIALPWLLQPWWEPVMARNRDALFFTTPRKLQVGGATAGGLGACSLEGDEGR
jgi:hypothetical protein